MSEIVYAVHTRACTYLLDEEGVCRWVLSRSGANSDDRCVGAQFVAALDLSTKGGLIGELRIGSSALFILSENGRFMLIRTKPIEHVEFRGAGAGAQSEASDEYPTVPDPEPDLLPAHHAVAAVFNAPAPAPEPEPPSARVILREGYYAEPPPPSAPPPPSFPRAPARMPAPVPVPPRPPMRDQAQATQPLPPTGRMPAWPAMLAPPPPPAEMVPLGPARPHLPSAEEIDVDDLEEVGEDEQVYSMEVTLSLPLFRPDPHAGPAWRRH